jgi:flagellar hook-basal body complex protein FliE
LRQGLVIQLEEEAGAAMPDEIYPMEAIGEAPGRVEEVPLQSPQMTTKRQSMDSYLNRARDQFSAELSKNQKRRTTMALGNNSTANDYVVIASACSLNLLQHELKMARQACAFYQHT